MSSKYLDHIRELNKAIASICHICKKQSTGINAYGYRIQFVCNEHLRREDDVILDTSIQGVLHYIYPNGKKPGLMDPNIGGLIPRNNLTDKITEPISLEDKDIWATQISFE